MKEQNITGDKKELKITIEQPMEDFIGLRMDISRDEKIIAYFYLKEKGWTCVEFQRWAYKEGSASKLFYEPIVCVDKEEIIPAFKKAYAKIIYQKSKEAEAVYGALLELHNLLSDGKE
jgi:hypothetical protein